VIRINLLPQKQRKKAAGASASSGAGGQKWLLFVLAALVLEAVAFLVFHSSKESELEAQNQKNRELQGQIQSIQQLVQQHDAVKKELAELRAREDAISSLQKARTGPTAALLELSQILTTGKGPTVDPDRYQELKKNNPLQVYNPGWDARRVWLANYKEEQRVVQIEGSARDSSDVSELAYRLNASSYFYDVRLLPGKRATGSDSSVVSFGMQMKVRY
jgi:type IV pilus assembly protein PilN